MFMEELGSKPSPLDIHSLLQPTAFKLPELSDYNSERWPPSVLLFLMGGRGGGTETRGKYA